MPLALIGGHRVERMDGSLLAGAHRPIRDVAFAGPPISFGPVAAR